MTEEEAERQAANSEVASDLATALLLEVTAALVADPPTELTIIEVADEAGIVTLRGRVADPRLRLLAEQIVAGYPGVSRAVNALEVVRPGPDD